MENLSFDPVKVDTSLAEEYLQKKCVAFEELEQGTAWNFENKTVVKIEEIEFLFHQQYSNLKQKLRNLSKKLEENSELFSQLDYLLRNTDVDETRKCHLKLISQYLRLEQAVQKPLMRFISSEAAQIVLETNTPLYYLGHISTVYHRLVKPVLFCEKTTAPICHLFYELCLEVGLEIGFYFVNNGDFDKLGRRYGLLSLGCTLAITEEADMESALHVFLNSPVQAPWRIERIYVQESAYEELMEVLEARCERADAERCVAAFRTARGRRVEVGAGAGAGGGVPVRAYRGARDLLALLSEVAGGGSLSLWCGATAAAHELALAAPQDLVWIDDYAAFDGPPSASIPFYSLPVRRRYIPKSDYVRLVELQRTWTALPEDERKAVVLDVLEKISSEREDAAWAKKFVDDIAAWTPADLVDIAPDRITMVIDRPDIVLLYKDTNILEFLKLAIRGYRVVVDEHHRYSMISELSNAGVPITKTNLYFNHTEFDHEIVLKTFYGNKKVIHSRFGTIYSN